MNNLEIEFKYSAEKIQLDEFKNFCLARKPKFHFVTSGYDTFYSHLEDKNTFYRFRENNECEKQLTFKRKISGQEDNVVRIEHNIDLDIRTSASMIAALVSEHGYKFNTSIYKICFVYKFDGYLLSYYVCYNRELNELGRFIEIEAEEGDLYSSREEAENAICIVEKTCRSLLISKKDRLNKSLFEMFRK